MGKFDYDLTTEERAKVLAALDAAEGGGLLDEHIGRLRGHFAWAQSEDFYAGYARGLLMAAGLCKENPAADHALLAGMLLLHTGLVVEHLQAE
jgi:hypothetical protein